MFKIKNILIICATIFTIYSCSDDTNNDDPPYVFILEGSETSHDEDHVPVGGQIKIGVSLVGGGGYITNLRVKRVVSGKTTVELDKGMYYMNQNLDTTLVFIKGAAEQEVWNVFIMNSNRDTASANLIINLGDGSAYGEIDYFSSITLGYQDNANLPHFLDLHSGNAYSSNDVAGHEGEIDLTAHFYLTSGNNSPTLSCPGYTKIIGFYPEIESWSTRNSTVYDYRTTDYDLVTTDQFDAAENDSLLVNSYLSEYTSGWCKYAYTGKIIPFKTTDGKYGMIKVIRADEVENGSMEVAVKIQK